MPMLISNSETAKYLHKVGENLIFLFTPIYFIVGLGRHNELLENTTHCKTPRHFLLDKIICEYLYELVIF